MARTDEKTNEMTELERKQDNDPVTWVGLAWRIIDIASQSNGKLLRVCALLLVVALMGVAWWWAPHVWCVRRSYLFGPRARPDSRWPRPIARWGLLLQT